MNSMIKFPPCAYPYTDSGEGGMFVKFIVYADDVKTDCCVDYAVESVNVSLTSLLSNICVASILIGTTHLSLWDDDEKEYWVASYLDLTEEGKQLKKLLENLYGPNKIHIVTFLDT